MKILYHPATAADRPFILSDCSRSYKHSHSAGMTPEELWAENAHKSIAVYLDRPTTITIMACDPANQEVRLGFVCADIVSRTFPYVYYLYVAQPFRRMRIANALLARAGVDRSKPLTFLCKTPTSIKLAAKAPLAKHDPFVGSLLR